MTNQDLINKLKEFPLHKPVVFFCNDDVFEGNFTWNECYIVDIKECLYIEFDDRIFCSDEELNEYHESLDLTFIIDDRKEIIRIDLNV